MIESVRKERCTESPRLFLNIAVDLYPGLVELGGPGQLLPAVDVGVVALGEGGLQLLQLLLGEGGPVPSSAVY